MQQGQARDTDVMWLKFAFQKLAVVFGWGDAWLIAPNGQLFPCGDGQEHYNWTKANLPTILSITPEINNILESYKEEYPEAFEKNWPREVIYYLPELGWQRIRFRKVNSTSYYELYLHTDWSPKSQRVFKDFVLTNIPLDKADETWLVVNTNRAVSKEMKLIDFLEGQV